VKTISILGSTGSIGVSTLDVCRQHLDKFTVIALTANTDVDKLLMQCQEFSPQYAVMVDKQSAIKLEQGLKKANCLNTEVLSGKESLDFVASLNANDMVMAAIVGAAGLLPALAAVKAGNKLLLANKEALVLSGHLFIGAARKNNVEILPIDSEHNAIFQCLPVNFHDGLHKVGVSKVLLTASGGPFLNATKEDLQQVTPEQAIAHPNWNMGKKISVDSATMMNKGLEVVEARWLFEIEPDFIQVVVHPQSIIHSMVEYDDGSVLAQMGNPDMRTPIAHAMAWPERIESGVKKLDLFEISQLDFKRPDFELFPCLRLAFDALKENDSATAILNAANEMTVESFLNNEIAFNDIPRINEQVLTSMPAVNADSIEQLLAIDQEARALSSQFIKERRH